MGFFFFFNDQTPTDFFQCLLSFFLPSVLPLIPIYIGYLSGGTGRRGEDGKIHFEKKKVMIHTFCFVVGVSFAFFLLGLGFSSVGTFFKDRQVLFARIGGVIVLLFGIYQLGFLGTSRFLGQEKRLPLKLNVLAMSPLTALLMGFVFSFAWTPCVGPALASVLIMAASASTQAAGMGLIGVYTLGFVIPFLAVGLFTTTLLEFFRNHMKVVRYTVKAGGILMVLMGILMITGGMNKVTGYLSGLTSGGNTSGTAVERQSEEETETEAETETETEAETKIPAIDFTLKDQYGNTHTLSDYKGKTVFLNFWATWCGPCRAEMPDIQKIYETWDQEGEDALVVLGIAAPLMGQETSEEEIVRFLEENGYTYPVVMDTTGEIFMSYGITAFPTTFMIDREGNVFGYAAGQLNEELMTSIIRQTMEGKRN